MMIRGKNSRFEQIPEQLFDDSRRQCRDYSAFFLETTVVVQPFHSKFSPAPVFF